jgi:hypothetical protein
MTHQAPLASRPASAPAAATANERLLLSALADRLIFGDPAHFAAEDARELARVMPPAPPRGFLSRLLPDISAKGSRPGRSASGYAAGVGMVSIRDSQTSFELDSRGRRVVRAGQWKLCRTSEGIEIEQVMADDDDEARTARLEYRLGAPVRMTLLTHIGFRIGPACITMGRFQPWKLPV